MKLTPIDIRHKEFRRAMRGYQEEEVDVFLDEIADEFERLFQANIDLQDRLVRLEDQAAQFENLKETLQKTLVSAQQQADEMRANARKEAELTMRDAELKARDIIADSYAEKQKVQQSLLQLRQVEEDFRFKFRSLLEAHINLLSQDENTEDRAKFRRVAVGVEENVADAEASVTPAAAVDSGATAGPAERALLGEDSAADVETEGSAVPLSAEPEHDGFATEEITAETMAQVEEERERDFAGEKAVGSPGGREAAGSAAAATAGATAEETAATAAGVARDADLADDAFLAKWDEKIERRRSSEWGAEVFGDLPGGDDESAGGIRPLPPEYEPRRKESGVRRFLFGSKGEEAAEGSEEEDRDFKW